MFQLLRIDVMPASRLIDLKIIKKLREEDKVKHMMWSFWLTLTALLFSSPLVSFIVVFILGVLKEWWDSIFGSGFCFYDIAGNIIGSVVCLALFFTFSLFYNNFSEWGNRL
jgi:hypothetical protein